MDKELFETGLKIRSEVLGKEYVENSIKSADEFNMPFQEFVTAYCWGGGWGRPGLTRKQRSMLNLAMIPILNRPHELKLHIRGALTNGVTKDEIREIFMQVGIYAGIPAGGRRVPPGARGVRRAGEEITRHSDNRGHAMDIGFIGLGNMGYPMARRLVEAGHKLIVYDTSGQMMSRLTSIGAVAAKSARDVADQVETVMASLPTPDIVLAVATGKDGVIEGKKVKRFLDCRPPARAWRRASPRRWRRRTSPASTCR